MRSSRLRVSLLAAGLLLAVAAPSFAQEDKYQAGTAAVNKGDAVAARDAFCSIDKSYKDAAAQCTTYTEEAKRQIARWNQNFIDGGNLLQQNKFDEAAFKFQNVKGGQYQALAAQQLAQIPKLKADFAAKAQAAQQSQQQQATAAADTEAQNKINNANAAFVNGDYATAKNLAGQLAGTKFAGQAQELLTRISQAESAKSSASSRPSAPAPKPQVDTGRLLADAAAAMKKHDYKSAQSLFSKVRAADPKNADAQQGLDDIAASGYEAEADVPDESLSNALSDFYKGNLDDAETALRNYRTTSGTPKPGLARFYYGATYLTRYYLGGASDPSLLQKAKDMFKEASTYKGFNPPEKYVSPKIMKVYKDATGS